MDLRFEMDLGAGFFQCPPPINWKSIQLRVLFVDDKPAASIETTEFQWVGENAERLNQYRAAGLTGGYGLYEGVGLRIYACTSQQLKVFDGFINLADRSTKWECDKVTASCRETGRIDWLNDRATAIDFAYLASLPSGSQGRIIPINDFKLLPYTISEIPNYTQAALLALQTFVVVKEALDAVCRIGQAISDLQGAVATATATVGAAVGLVISALAMTILYIGYLAGIIIALVNLVQSIIENVIQLKKYKLCMLARTHFIRACEYFGLTFSSTILNDVNSPYYNDTWLPEKTVIPDPLNPLAIFKRGFDESQNFPNNPDVYGYYDGNFSQFIVEYCNRYKAGIVIIGNTLHFEHVLHWNVGSVFQIPNQGLPGFTQNYPDPFLTNASELSSNYAVMWSLDQSDLQTLHRDGGRVCTVNISPITVRNPRNVAHGNGVTVQFSCARAKRKEYLSKVENLVNAIINALFGFVNNVTALINGLINIINWVIGLFGGNTTAIPTIPPLPTNILNNRIGWMEVSNDSFAVPKSFIGIQVGADWHISTTDEQLNSALELMNRFHGKMLATRGNQQLIFEDKAFKFCCADFAAVLNKNVATAPDGQPAKLKELLWDLHSEQATGVEYRVFTNFTNNLQETVITDGS